MALSPGDRLGGYEIVGLLGAGGMRANVFNARNSYVPTDSGSW